MDKLTLVTNACITLIAAALVTACDENTTSTGALDGTDMGSVGDVADGTGDVGDGADEGDGHDAATDAVSADSSDCGERPTGPGDLVCQAWLCQPQPAPACWSCSAVAAGDGHDCELSGAGGPGLCVAGTCAPLPDPGAAGEVTFTYSSYDLELEDGIRPPTAAITMYVPNGEGPFPVVVFHHGFQLGTELYASYGDHLASWGYLVVMPEMPGGLIGGPNHVDLKEYLITVLDWLEGEAGATEGPLVGKIDLERIGLAGHSLGGKISLFVATEDDRPLAVFAIDPVDAAGGPLPVAPEDFPSVTPELMDLITVPTVYLGETTNGTCTGLMCQACAPEGDNFHQYYTHAAGPALEIEVVGANHMSFLDNPNCGLTCSVCPAGTDDPASTRQLTQRYMTAFFNVFLRGEASYNLYLTGSAMDADVADGSVVSVSKNGF